MYKLENLKWNPAVCIYMSRKFQVFRYPCTETYLCDKEVDITLHDGKMALKGGSSQSNLSSRDTFFVQKKKKEATGEKLLPYKNTAKSQLATKNPFRSFWR